MSLPVGVGRRSPGPSGNVGSTIDTGTPCAAARSTSCSATYFVRLYEPKRWAMSAYAVSSDGRPRAVPSTPSTPTVLVYTMRSQPAVADGVEHVQRAADVDVGEQLRVARPERVDGREVEHEARVGARVADAVRVAQIDRAALDDGPVLAGAMSSRLRSSPPARPARRRGRRAPGRRA